MKLSWPLGVMVARGEASPTDKEDRAVRKHVEVVMAGEEGVVLIGGRLFLAGGDVGGMFSRCLGVFDEGVRA